MPREAHNPFFFFFQAGDGIRDLYVTGVQTCALPISLRRTRETAAPLERRWRFTARIEPAVGEIPSPMEDPAARGEWLRGVMAGVWSAQADDLKLWRQDVADALLALQRPTIVVTHFVAINVAVGIAEGDDRVIGFAPDHCSVTVLDIEDGALRLVRRGAQRATQVL